jgi:hypothetical protein
VFHNLPPGVFSPWELFGSAFLFTFLEGKENIGYDIDIGAERIMRTTLYRLAV